MLTVVDSAVEGGEGLQLYPQGETGGVFLPEDHYQYWQEVHKVVRLG